jgi:hypothetical protein
MRAAATGVAVTVVLTTALAPVLAWTMIRDLGSGPGTTWKRFKGGRRGGGRRAGVPHSAHDVADPKGDSYRIRTDDLCQLIRP